MGEPVVQTLFRCGVCFEMFTTSDECYSHIVAHEMNKTTEQGTTSLGTDVDAESGDAVSQEAGDRAVPQGEEKDESQMISFVSDGSGTSTQVVGKVEDGVTVSVTSNVPGVLGAGACAVKEEAAPEMWVGKVGEVLQVQHGDMGRSTNEDLDIADILINIKQEKPDDIAEDEGGATIEQNDLVQLTNQVVKTNTMQNVESSTNVKLGTKTGKIKTKNKGKKKSSKTVVTSVKEGKVVRASSPLPVVRRRKKGVDSQDVRDNGSTYDCRVCGKRYAILKSLKYHERTHDTKNLHYCDVCGKGFVKPSELSNHQKSHLTNKEIRGQNLDMYKCKYCDKEYRIEKSLKHHEKVHELGNRYTCVKCDKAFFKPSDLERHRKVHKPLAKCYICSKPFRDPRKLEFHVRQHPELLLQEENKTHVKTSCLLFCKYCSKKCSTFSQLCNHVRTHTKKKPFPCDICGKMFNRVSNMRLHRKLHSGNKPFHCQQCRISFADFANRNRHMKKYHTSSELVQMNYKPRCSKVAVVDELPPAPKLKVRRETLVNELRSAYEELDVLNKTPNLDGNVMPMKPSGQKGKNLIQCREVQGIPQQVQEMITVGNCQIQVPPKVIPGEALETSSEQVYVVFEDNPSVCYVLEYEGDKTVPKLVEHVERQTKSAEEQTLTTENTSNIEMLVGDEGAEGATRISISAADLENADTEEAVDCELPIDVDSDSDAEESTPNTSDVIEKEAPPRQNRYGLRRHSCSVCGLLFKHQGSLKFHFKKHTKEGVMYCEVCNAEFYRKSRLRIHMRDHTGERPYKCSDCEQTFKVHYDLTVHMRHHTGFGSIQCHHCDMIFYTRRALNAHMRNQSKEKPYSCTLCGKLFKRKDQRRRHMLIHGGNLPFKCHMCERSFGDSSNRKRHIIKNHGRDALETLPKGRISLVKNMKA